MASPLAQLRAAALAALAALGCATGSPRPPPPGPSAAPPVSPGMDAATLRRTWGEPASVERISSPAAPGLVYERWSWGAPGEGRTALLVGGRVVDLLDPSAPPSEKPPAPGATPGP